MKSRLVAGTALLVALSTSSLAAAKDEPAAANKDGVTVGADGVRRDPKGVKGISPFWEAIKKGDDAIAARDAEGAKAKYQEAIRSEPHHPMGHYRLGEAELTKGNLKGAEESWQSGLRFAGQDPTLKAKLLFLIADVKERQRALEEARNGWNAYEGFAKVATEAKTYPGTPPERIKRIEDLKKIEAEYTPVKERIAQRLAEAEKKAAADAQSAGNR